MKNFQEDNLHFEMVEEEFDDFRNHDRIRHHGNYNLLDHLGYGTVRDAWVEVED